MARWLFLAGAAPFLILGTIHAAYTFHDAVRPRRLAPRDPALVEAMKAAPLRLAPETDMWRAWIGFNFSHSVGAIVFGLVAAYLALFYPASLEQMTALRVGALLVALAYAALARTYWFSVPFWGTVAGAAAFAASLALSVLI